MTRRRSTVGLGLGLGLAVLAAIGANAVARTDDPLVVPITFHYSHFSPATVTIPAGRPVTFVITNTDPIDHEWIVGDEATHERHRTGTEPTHGSRPTEVTIPAGTERRTTVTFDPSLAPGSQRFICHLPGHEAYGMVGTVLILTGG
jgi:uncharacterized cupredoxin-like copper-binding protein